MPTGWAQANGYYRNLLVAAGEDAIEMGGVVEINPSLFQLRSTWNGGVDPLTVTPTWADQVTGITEVDYGWEGSLPNGNVVSLLDPQLTKLPDILADYMSGGAKVVQTMPVSSILGNYAGGTKWLAEQFHLGGAENWLLPVQPDESGNPDVEQPDWAISSIPAYHVSKANNIIGGDCCRVGKRNHFHRPYAAFWDEQPRKLKGVVAGELAIIDGKLSKLYPMAEMAALIAVSDLVSVDADLGYTSIGTSLLNASDNHYIYFGQLLATENGTVDSYTYGTVLDINGTSITGGLYTGNVRGTASGQLPLVTDSGLRAACSSVASGGRFLATVAFGGTKPTISNGTDYTLMYHYDDAAFRVLYDAGGTAPNGLTQSNGSDAQGNPVPALTFSPVAEFDFLGTGYLTYTPGGGPSGTADQSGLAIDLSI